MMGDAIMIVKKSKVLWEHSRRLGVHARSRRNSTYSVTENKVLDASYPNHGTIYVFLSHIELVLMRKEENLLMEMGDVSCIFGSESGRVVGYGTKLGG